MPRKPRRKFYKPHSPESKAKISAGVRAYQERVRAALANSEAARG